MYKVVLLNLPFTSQRYPSIALTQLKYVLEEKFGKKVTTEIYYLNHDFVHYLGSGLHEATLQENVNFSTGFADWFFRQTAFPALPDNTDEYLQRFYPGSQKQARWLYTLLKKRQGLEAFLDEQIEKYHLGQAHLVGLISMFFQNLACFSMARKLKEVQPDIVTVMGGTNCETPMGEEIVKNVEALSTSLLKLMKKGTTAFQNLRLLKHCATYEVYPLWNLLFGFPREKEEVYQKYLHDLPLFHHLPPPTTLYPIRFDRYSPYLTQAEEYGLVLRLSSFETLKEKRYSSLSVLFATEREEYLI